MKKDDNSGVSIKQIMMTALFLTVTTFGGLNAYRIVCDYNAKTIQNIESANVENVKYETALVENTEDDVIYSENIKFLAAKTISEQEENSEMLNKNIMQIRNKTNFGEKVISRGNYVREMLANDILANATNDESNVNKLRNTVVNEIKEFSEKQDERIESVSSEIKNNLVKNNVEENNLKDKAVIENYEEGIVEEDAEDSSKEVANATEALKVIDESVQTLGAPTEYVRTIDVKATAYCLCKKCCGKSPSNPDYGVTASGLKIVPGTGMKVVASDPSVIPLGTKVYIEGLYGASDYGYAIVADTGSAIKNLKIDLYMDTHQMALNWGVKNVRVYLLDN